MPTATLTAHEVARENLRRGEDLTVAVDRLRWWTKIGAIKPIGERHPGTGSRRRYRPVAILEMAYLQALADVGVEARGRRGPETTAALRILRSPEYLAPFLEQNMAPAERPLLVISRSSDGRTWDDVKMRSPDELLAWITKSDREVFTHDSYRVIDAQKIRDRLMARIEGGRYGDHS
jgi:hypothetical protein